MSATSTPDPPAEVDPRVAKRRAVELLASAKDLAVLPSSYLRLARVLDRPAATADQIAEAVRLDPALTARLLRLVNSAAYAPPKRVDAVPHAVTMAGVSRIKQMALAASLVRMFRGIPEHLLDMTSFWTHSVAVAQLASTFASATRRINPETAFIAGLLHDVGELLVCLRQPGDARRVLAACEDSDRPPHVIEKEILGFSHADAGALLLHAWAIAPSAIAAAGFHHVPSTAPPEALVAVDLVHVADVAVSALQIGNAGERAAHRLQPSSWSRTTLRPDQLDAALRELDEQLPDMLDVFTGG
ncbi:MAG: HDOD domain-containing protein [Myxococcota bacterium]